MVEGAFEPNQTSPQLSAGAGALVGTTGLTGVVLGLTGAAGTVSTLGAVVTGVELFIYHGVTPVGVLIIGISGILGETGIGATAPAHTAELLVGVTILVVALAGDMLIHAIHSLPFTGVTGFVAIVDDLI